MIEIEISPCRASSCLSLRLGDPVLLYVISAVLFLIIDAIMLTMVMKPLFTRQIGDVMRNSPMLGPAAAFYLAYVAGLVFLVSVPAVRDAAPGRAALHGAIVGAMAYGTYEFTSMSIMKNWSWAMVATDTLWGAALTARRLAREGIAEARAMAAR